MGSIFFSNSRTRDPEYVFCTFSTFYSVFAKETNVPFFANSDFAFLGNVRNSSLFRTAIPAFNGIPYLRTY